jgi:ribosomal protein S18 acetylase RimI-like enzyme
MIKLINHTVIDTAKDIYRVFQVSYPYEAKLLGVTYFPPLNRTTTDFQESTTLFYGFYEGVELAAVMELDVNENYTLIRSLIVDPDFFRKGIASKLVQYAIENDTTTKVLVETGNANIPAKTLYIKHNFIEEKVWMTDVGIEKVGYVLMK